MPHRLHYQWIIVPFLTFSLLFGMPVVAQDESMENDIYLSIDSSVNVLITTIASKREKISDAPGVISVVTQDQLKRFAGMTLGDILKRVPSFLGTTIYMTDRSAIASRGDQILPASSHTLLLINGRPMREILEGGIKSEVYESFPVGVIERIEIIRGPGSVLYGSQAFSAVINVITKKPENNTVTVSGLIGDALSNYIMADLQYKIGNLGVVVAGRYADKGDWKLDWDALGKTDVYTHHLTIPDYGPGAYGELQYLDKKYLNFRFMGSYCQWKNQFYLPDFQYLVADPASGVTEITGPVTWKKLFTDFGYSIDAFSRYKLNANITFTRSWLATERATPQVFRDGHEIITELTNFFTPIDNLNITLGGVWGYMTGIEKDNGAETETLIFNTGHKQNTISGYTQIDYRGKWFKAIGGLQTNKVADYKADFNPRAGLILYPLQYVNIKALYSTAFRAPSLNELFLDYPRMKGKKMGELNPDWPDQGVYSDTLYPEKVHTFDFGVNYQNDKVLFGVNAFHSRMENLIIQDRSGKYLHPTYDNLSDATIFGLECEGTWYITDEVFFEGSFLYQQSEDEKTGEENVTPLSNFSAKGGLSFRSEWGLTISAFNTFQQALDEKYSSTLNTTTGHFNMVDVHCSYNVNKLLRFSKVKKLALVLDIDNLLDEEIWLPAWGNKRGSTIPYHKGRTVYGGFKVAF